MGGVANLIAILTVQTAIPIFMGGIVFAVLFYDRRQSSYQQWSIAYFSLAAASVFGATVAGPRSADEYSWSLAALASLICLGLFFHFHAAASMEFTGTRYATAIAASVSIVSLIGIVILNSLSRNYGALSASSVVMLMFCWEGYLLKDEGVVGRLYFGVNVLRGVAVLARPLAMNGDLMFIANSSASILLGTGSVILLLMMAVARERAAVERNLADLGVAHRLLQRQAATLEEITIELGDQRRRAAAADEAKFAFLTNVNHEFRTPLNAVLGFSEILQRNTELDARTRKAISNIHGSAKTLFAFVEKVIELARVTSEIPRDSHVANLVETVDDAIERVQQQSSQKAIAIRPRPPPHEVSVKGDPFIISRALGHLLDNAVTYSPAGSTIELFWLTRPDGTVSLQIVDRGPGMASNISAQEPEMFVRGDTVTGLTTPGLGIGLYITRRLLDLVGANLAFSPNPEGGTIAAVGFEGAGPVANANTLFGEVR